MISITLNGKSESTDCRTLQDLITEIFPDVDTLIVEHNYRIIHKNEWENTILKHNDNIEMLSFVGGG